MRKLVLSFLLFWTLPAFAQRFSDNSDYAFAVKFLKTGFEMKKGNFIISPLSVYFAADLLANGADGESLQELNNILSPQDPNSFDLNQTNEAIKNYMQKKSKQIEINNSIWGNQFRQDYIDFVQHELAAEPKKLPSNTSVINKWVEEKTKGKIKDIIQPKNTSQSDLYLVNTIYFKDEWQKKLNFITKKDFYSLDGKTDKVNMIGTQATLNYYEDNLMQSIELRYKNGDSMRIFLPKESIAFEQFIQKLNPDYLSSLRYKNELVRLNIPRFDVGIKVEDMISLFKQWGIESIFSNRANLSKLSNIQHLVSAIIHAANISVDEEGTEASAATVIEMKLTSPGPGIEKPQEPKIFNADRPFVFMINNGLFIGTYTKGSLVAKRGEQISPQQTEQPHRQKSSSNNYVRPRQQTSVTYNRSPAYNNQNQTRGGVSHIKRR